jgi:hypothetical protein
MGLFDGFGSKKRNSQTHPNPTCPVIAQHPNDFLWQSF